MGIYSEYIDRKMDFAGLQAERKIQLKRLSKLRAGRDVLVVASDLKKEKAPISLDYGDLLPVNDQLANMNGGALDLILETPGGSGVAAEDVVKLLRHQYNDIAVIVPGWAKSAGTIIAMSGDDILMEPASALGPIDAQLSWQGKVFSADALIKGFERIKEEVRNTGTLNRAYVPILSAISPGELESAQNALDFAKDLVTDWLARYKFAKWLKHSSTGAPVTDNEKRARAAEIANQLCDHTCWRTHGRSIKIADLERMRLKVTDYSRIPSLADALRRYYTLLNLTFDNFGVYKVFETKTSQIYRLQQQATIKSSRDLKRAIIEIKCPKCQEDLRVQANFEKGLSVEDGCIVFPANGKINCPRCNVEIDLSPARNQLEAQVHKPIVLE